MGKRIKLLGFIVLMFIGKISCGLYITQFMLNNDDMPSDMFSTIESSVIQNPCDGCKWVVALIRYYIKLGLPTQRVVKMGSYVCENFKLQTSDVCRSGLQLLFPELIEIAKNVSMTTAEICYFMMDDYCDEVKLPEWSIPIPPKTNVPKAQKNHFPKKGAPVLKVLHLSDVHLDPLYVEGTNAICPEPLCCREQSGIANISANAAGKWGDYRCDIPRRTFEHLLDHIYKTHNDIDYVIWTGDIAPHDIWMQTNEKTMRLIEDSVELMSEKLPGLIVYPAIGNHERAPVNSFPTIEQDDSIAKLYNDIETLWSRWLPPNVSSTLHLGAFYSVLIKPGFRIISMNTNVCATFNFWLLQNSTDPNNELKWLVNELQMAENASEKVHIIGHIAPGSEDCVKMWSHNYYDIIARYEKTIAAQFFGHEHYDQFEVFYDPKNLSRPVNIAYLGPAITSFSNLNPTYRIYHIDGDHDGTTRTVVDHETWTMDLEQANLNDNPVYFKSYSVRDAYSMQGLSPNDWHEFIENMKTDDKLFELYYKHYWQSSPLRPTCESDCKREILCQAKSGRSHDKVHLCMDLETTTEGNEDLVEVPQSDSSGVQASKSSQMQHKFSQTFIKILVFGLATLLIFMV